MTDSTPSLSQPLYGATIGQAIDRFFKKYTTFAGRASRSEYWWVALAVAVVNTVFSILFAALGGSYTPGAETASLSGGAIVIIVLWGVFNLAIIIPWISLTVRRLHDGNFSGWFFLFSLIGLSIIVFILTLLPSKPEGARFDV